MMNDEKFRLLSGYELLPSLKLFRALSNITFLILGHLLHAYLLGMVRDKIIHFGNSPVHCQN